ncbi:MAG: SH3 domain-containing protein, partial [Pseudomonadota bacterium]
IRQPGLEIGWLFRQVTSDVLEATNNKQRPFLYGSLPPEPVYFSPPKLDQTKPAPAKELQTAVKPKTAPSDEASQAWQAISQSASPAMLKVFISRYPDSVYTAFAEARLSELEAVASAAAPAQTLASNNQRERLEVELKRRAEDFVRYRYLGSSRTDEAHYRSIFADLVDYYGKPSVPRQEVIRDKRAYFRRWSSFEYLHRSGSYEVLTMDDPALVRAQVTMSFRVENDDKRIEGLAETTLTLRNEPEGLRITSENSRTLDTRTTDLKPVVRSTASCSPNGGSWHVSSIRTNDTLLVRSGPSKSFGAIGELPWNAQGIATSACRAGKWCKISFGCIRGYAFGKYLSQGNVGERSSRYSARYSVVDHPSSEPLNVRSGPGTNYPVVGGLPYNARDVRVGDCQRKTGFRFRWCTVEWQGTAGWAYGKYLANGSGAKPLP